MTTLFKVQSINPADASNTEIMCPTKKDAEKEMTRLRNDGLDSVLTEIDLVKPGVGSISSKELMCRLFNRQQYTETGVVIKKLAGLKNPK